MNQAKINNDGITNLTREITLEALISPISNYRDKIEDIKHYKRDLATPLYDNFIELNKIPLNPIEYNSKDLLGIISIRKQEDLKRTIGIKFKSDNIPQKHINRQENIKVNLSKKKKKSKEKKLKSYLNDKPEINVELMNNTIDLKNLYPHI